MKIKDKPDNIQEHDSLPRVIKIILAILGGTNIIFSIFLPIAVALIINRYYDLNIVSRIIVIIAGCFSSLYRAIDVGGIETIEYFFYKLKMSD